MYSRTFVLVDTSGIILPFFDTKRLAYNPDLKSAHDYYPFGMIEPARTFATANPYRFGFNGKENDNEIKGLGNQQDYGRRVYDPRLGKFLSLDPLAKIYPHYTPYSFAGNKPISFIDRDGEEKGSLEINTRRREEAYLRGKISDKEYKNGIPTWKE